MYRLSSFLAVVLLAASFQEGKATLQWKRSAGDAAKVKINSELQVDIKTTDSEGSKTRTATFLGAGEFAQTVQEADAGAATILRVDCKESTRQVGGDSQKTGLQGRKFVVHRSSAAQVTAEDGLLVPPEAQALGAWENAAALLPSKDVAQGESWKIDGAKVAQIVSVVSFKDAKGEVTVKLDSIGGGKATLSFSGTLEGRTEDGYSAKVTLDDCALVLDAAKSAPVSVTIQGGVELHRTVVERRREGIDEVDNIVGEVSVRSSKLKVDVTFE